jgi:hypothetical protein
MSCMNVWGSASGGLSRAAERWGCLPGLLAGSERKNGRTTTGRTGQ